MTDSANGALLRQALKQTCSLLPQELRSVPLQHWNESSFRYFFVKQLLAIAPELTCWSEWNRVDLVVPSREAAILIEFKFYLHAPLQSIHGTITRMKGRPSLQNFREFTKCIAKFGDCSTKKWFPDCGQATEGWLVLAYFDPEAIEATQTYGHHYGNLESTNLATNFETFADKIPLPGDVSFTCRLLTFPLGSPSSAGPR